MENQNFEWSESGLRLLDEINGIIDSHGGVSAMYEIVNEEVNESQYSKDKRIKLDLLRIIRRYGMPIQDALPILKMTRSQYERFKAENK
ncbi:hypothetical protein D3C87_755740 [compost metagenome]